MNNTPQIIGIGNRGIGPGHPTLIIAEIGMNHNGDVHLGMDMIRAAAAAGADAVKIQTFRTDHFLSASYFDCEERKQYELNTAEHVQLQDCAAACGVEFFSTPLDNHSVKMLCDIGVRLLKVASCDLTNIPLLQKIGATGKPVLLSTGYAEVEEIETARNAILAGGCPHLAILHCVAVYPTPDENAHLNNIPMLQHRFPEHVIGLSDHSMDVALIPACAVALGARIVEKHFTTDRQLPGYDHAMSLTPDSFSAMTQSIRRVENALGQSRAETGVIPGESDRRQKARRSLFWNRSLKKGETVTPDTVLPKRPGTGLAPALLDSVHGRTVAQDVQADTLVRMEQLEA